MMLGANTKIVKISTTFSDCTNCLGSSGALKDKFIVGISAPKINKGRTNNKNMSFIV